MSRVIYEVNYKIFTRESFEEKSLLINLLLMPRCLGYKRPPSPRPRPLDRVPAPVIYSSYASSVVQGRGQEEQKRIQETFDKYERLNEISDEDIDIEKVEQTAKRNDKEEEEVEAEERVVEATVELIRKTEEEESEMVTEEIKQKTETTSTTETTTEHTSRAPAKDADFTSEKVGLTESPAINGEERKVYNKF